MKGAVWFGLDIGLIARGTATFFLPIAADENAIVRPPPTWSFPLTALKKYREHVVGSVPAPFGADLSPLACSIRTQYISLLQASDPEIFACSWLGLAGRRVCQGPSLTSQQFCPLIPPCRLARRRHFEIPSSAKLRETRDPNYIESRVERFTRNFIRDRPRHSAHIECNDPRHRVGPHRDRSCNPQFEKLPPKPTKGTAEPPRDIQHLGQQNQRFGRKAHTLCGKKCTRHDPNQSPAGQADDMNPQIPHTPPESDIQAIVAKLRTPSKPQLQSICVVNGLPKTGNKADLSHRIEKRKLLVFSTSSLFSPKPPPPTISARLPFSHVTMRTLPLLTLFHQ